MIVGDGKLGKDHRHRSGDIPLQRPDFVIFERTAEVGYPEGDSENDDQKRE